MRRAALVPVSVLAFPALAAAAPSTFAELMYLGITYMNYMSQILVVATLVVYLGGAAYMLWKQGTGSTAELRKFLMIGIAIMFVMVSVWGILELLSNTLSSGGADIGTGRVESYCNGLDECDI
jgi:hypothetical protein